MEDSPSKTFVKSSPRKSIAKEGINKESIAVEKENIREQKKLQRQRGGRYRSSNYPDVFERNYQYAFTYKAHRNELQEKRDAAATGGRHFKAQPMPIGSPPRKKDSLPKFTVPYTPEVLKRSTENIKTQNETHGKGNTGMKE